MSDKIYCYPDSDVLINKLGIRDLDRLQMIERRLTMIRLAELIKHPIKGNFDLEHLQKIHHYIFQDIYEWAGKIRTVDIAKGNMFCNVRFIDIQADEIFGRLKRENYLLGTPRDVFVKKCAYYFSEINALHPFREGNGRIQREFVRSLAARNGYRLMFQNAGEEEMLLASQKSFLCDYVAMEDLFNKITEP